MGAGIEGRFLAGRTGGRRAGLAWLAAIVAVRLGAMSVAPAILRGAFVVVAVSAKVFERDPYSQHTGRDTFNDGDSIFDEATLLKLSEDGDGYLGVLALDVEVA